MGLMLTYGQIDVPVGCPPVRAPAPPVPATPYPETRTGTGEEVFKLPYLYKSPESKPEPEKAPTAPPSPLRIPTRTPKPDYIWRGLQKINPATSDFHPRIPDDIGGISMYEGRLNMFRATSKSRRWRAGFTYHELLFEGFSVGRDSQPPGHRSIKRTDLSEWDDWLHRKPGQPYSISLRDLARRLNRIEPNDYP